MQYNYKHIPVSEHATTLNSVPIGFGLRRMKEKREEGQTAILGCPWPPGTHAFVINLVVQSGNLVGALVVEAVNQ
jgi:hypothetical protein